MMKLLIIGLGGFLGAVCRYGLGSWVLRLSGGTFPYGTLVVNLLGCFLLGGLIILFEQRQLLNPGLRVFLTVGLLGAFTTFSTFSYETLELMREKSVASALANILANVTCGLLAVLAGGGLVRLLGR